MAFSDTGAFAGFQPAGARRYDDARSRRAAVDRIDMLATVFDTAFVVPGTGFASAPKRCCGLCPVSAMRRPRRSRSTSPMRLHGLVCRASCSPCMLANVLLEGAVGAVPFAGDAFDILFRANRRNVALLREHFARTGYN